MIKIVLNIYNIFFKKKLKFILYGGIFSFFILSIAFFTINTTTVQTAISKKFLQYFNKKLNTSFLIEKVYTNFIGDTYLYNVKFIDNHKNILFLIPKVKIYVNIINLILNFKNTNIKKLKFFNPKINIITYYGDKKNNLNYSIEKLNKNKKIKNIFEKKIEIKNGSLIIINKNLKKNKVVFQTKNLNLDIKNFKIYKKKISAKIYIFQNNGFYHKKYFQLKNFSTNINFTSKSLIFENINIKTLNSYIKSKLIFKYLSLEDFKYFNKKIFFILEIYKGSKLNSEDLNLFINNWNKKYNINLSGKISGKIEKELLLNNFNLQINNNQIKSNEIKLFKITSLKDYKIIKKNGFIKTSYNNLQKLFPHNLIKKIPYFIKNYGELSLYGILSIESKKIIVKGILNSKLFKNIYTNIEINNYNNKKIQYSGKLYGNKLDSIFFIKKKKIHSINGNINFKGIFLFPNNIEINLKGVLSKIILYNKLLNNIYINGKLTKSSFEGFIDIKDIKGKVNFDGKITFLQKKLTLNAKINIKNINLHALGFTKKKKSLLSSKIEIKIQENKINELEVEIYMHKVIYENKNKVFKIPEIKIQGIKKGKKRKIILESEIIKGEIIGNFSWDTWVKVLKNELKNLINKKKKYFKEKSYLIFDLNIKNTLMEILEKKISLSSINRFYGKIETNKNIKLNFFIKNLQIKNNVFENIKFYTDELIKKKIQLKIDKAIIKGILLKNIILSTISKNNLLLINSKFLTEWNGNEQLFELNFYKKNNWIDKKQNFFIGLNKSKIIINGYNWWINKCNNKTHELKINLNKDIFFIKKLEIISSEGQYLELSINFKKGKYQYIRGKIKNLQIKKLFIKKNQNKTINGVINGRLFIENFNNIFRPNIKINISKISIDNYLLDNIKIFSFYNKENKNYLIKGYIENKGIKIINLYGLIKNKKQKKIELDLKLFIQKIPINLINIFLGKLFDDIYGDIQGKIRINGPFNNLNYKGILELKKAGLKLKYLNTEYKLKNKPIINISNNLIKFKNFHFEDIKYKTKGDMNLGKLYKKKLGWNFLFIIESQNILLLNTHSFNKDNFYGTIFASSIKEKKYNKNKPFKIKIFGKTNNLKIKIENAIINKPSQIFINTSKSKLIEKIPKYIHFKNEKNLFKENNKNPSYTLIKNKKNKKISLYIESLIGYSTQIKFFIDKYNFINAKGEGQIFLKIDSQGNIHMTGSSYKIINGIYQFSNKQIPFLKFDRKFNIRPGGNIIWNGNFMNAIINIEAYYPKIISNIGEYLNLDNKKIISNISTELSIYISGSFINPKIKFDIKFIDIPENIKEEIFKHLNTNDKILKQFGSILLFGKFFIDNDKNIFKQKLTSSGYDIAFKQLGDILSSIYNPLNINFEYIQGNKGIIIFNSFRSLISYDINKRFTLKGSLEFPINSFKKKKKIIGDIQMNIDISKKYDKSLKIILFSNLNILEKNNKNIQKKSIFYSQNHGIGIIYTTKFNSFKELKNKIFSK